MEMNAPRNAWITAEQLYEMPDDGARHELLRGFVVAEPTPGRLHGRTIANIASILKNFVKSTRSGVVYAADTGFVLARDPDTVRGPDVAFVTNERERQAGGDAPYFPGAPDLAIEVISPSERVSEVLGKVSDYLSAGSRLVWVVDPVRHEVRVFRSPLTPHVLGAHDALDGEDVLPGFSVRVSELFETY